MDRGGTLEAVLDGVSRYRVKLAEEGCPEQAEKAGILLDLLEELRRRRGEETAGRAGLILVAAVFLMELAAAVMMWLML